jgi:hypothetical protein
MPFRFRRSITIAPGVRVNLGKRGISSATVGRTNLRRGYTPKTTIRLSGDSHGSGAASGDDRERAHERSA